MQHWTERVRRNRYPYSMPQRNNDLAKAAILAAIMTATAVASAAGVFFGLKAMTDRPRSDIVTTAAPAGKQGRIVTKMQDRIPSDPRFQQNVIIRNVGNETIVERMPRKKETTSK